MDLKGKTAINTGGATGLSAATARKLAGQGVKFVFNFDRKYFKAPKDEYVFSAITQKEKALLIYISNIT